MSRNRWTLFLAFMSVLLIASAQNAAAASAAPASQKPGKGKGQAKQAEASAVAVGVVFTAEHRRIIAEYWQRGSGLPPGLAKREELPPGLRKQLVRKGTLPPGLQKKLVAFPPDLEARLPRLPEGYHRGFVAGHAVIYIGRSFRIEAIFALP